VGDDGALSRVTRHLRWPEDPSQARRLFHGRGRGVEQLQHVTVDWLPPVALIQLYSPEPGDDALELAREIAHALPTCQSVQLQHRYLSDGPVEVVLGDSISSLAVSEGDLKFQVSLGRARNTGLFLDMRNGRRWVREHSQGQRVLNLFAYTCGFSVAAVAGGARAVLNVDMSSPSLRIGRENHRLNQQETTAVGFEKLDIFKSFGRMKRRGPFDLLICDPPTFQKGSVDVARDYPKILRRLDQFMAPGATLMLCLNAPNLGRDFLIDHVAALAPRYTLAAEVPPPAVFVEAEDEAKGLKTLIFEAIDC
jgi:23S rRNA (cytosine1962-C5)-methyltransferase